MIWLQFAFWRPIGQCGWLNVANPSTACNLESAINGFQKIASAQKPWCFFAMESALRWKPSCNMGFLRRPAQKAWSQPRNPIQWSWKVSPPYILVWELCWHFFWARHGVGFWPGNPLWRSQKKSLVYYVIICFLERIQENLWPMWATFHQSLHWRSAYGCATPGSGWEWEHKLRKIWNSAFPVQKLSQTSPGVMNRLKSKWKRDDFCIVYFQPNKCKDLLPWWCSAVESIYQFQQLADVQCWNLLVYSRNISVHFPPSIFDCRAEELSRRLVKTLTKPKPVS